ETYNAAKVDLLEKLKAKKQLETDPNEDVNLGVFAAILNKKLTSFIKELITLKVDVTPILISELKISLKYALLANNYLINDYIYKDIISVLPDDLEPNTRKNVANKIISTLEKYSLDYIQKLLKEKTNAAIRKDLRKAKSLESILPTSDKAILNILLQKNIEDTKHPDHSGVSPDKGISKDEYVRSVRNWSELVQDSMRSYQNEKKINITNLLKTIDDQFSQEKNDAVLYDYIYKMVRNYLASPGENEIEGTKVAGIIADAFSVIQNDKVETYYNYELYKNLNNYDFDGTMFPSAALFDHWLDAAIVDVPYNDNPDYKEFQEKLTDWTTDLIKTINRVKNQDTLFYASQYRQQLGLLSSNYGDIDPLMSKVLYTLQNATKLIQRGNLLSDLINQAVSSLDSLARSDNERMAGQWKQQKFSFPLKFSSQLKNIYEDVKANASFDAFQYKIDTWTTDSKDLTLEAKSSSWSDNTTFRTADLSQELEYLFDEDISGLRGIAFIYNDFLKVALEKENTTIAFKDIHSIWKNAMEDAQLDKVLKKEYTNYTKTYYPEAIEELIDSMEFIFPSALGLKAALSASKTSSKRQKLNTNPNTLIVNYQLNWEKRKTLIELSATEIHNEIHGGSDLVSKGEIVFNLAIEKIKAKFGSSSIENLGEEIGNVLAATFRTDVPSDNIQLQLPLTIKKIHKNGQNLIFADFEAINNGAILFQKASPYTLARIDISKIGKTIFENNIATHRIQMVIDVDDMELAKNISAGVVVAGAEIGLTLAPKKYTIRFELIVQSVFENGELSVQVIPRSSTVPNNNDCPLLNECTGPTADILRLNPFSE
ncbi:MAG: hypothetical protein JKY03_03190, partial [Aureispira sp.]|nr:hypothetical protein [Aureispira sp.]